MHPSHCPLPRARGLCLPLFGLFGPGAPARRGQYHSAPAGAAFWQDQGLHTPRQGRPLAFTVSRNQSVAESTVQTVRPRDLHTPGAVSLCAGGKQPSGRTRDSARLGRVVLWHSLYPRLGLPYSRVSEPGLSRGGPPCFRTANRGWREHPDCSGALCCATSDCPGTGRGALFPLRQAAARAWPGELIPLASYPLPRVSV